MFVLDTNIIALLSPNKGDILPEFKQWAKLNSKSLFISSLTIAEISKGIAQLNKKGATKKAIIIDEWLQTLLIDYKTRIISFDKDIALVTGTYLALNPSIGFVDCGIAATAHLNKFTLITRNVKDFTAFELKLLNPYSV